MEFAQNCSLHHKFKSYTKWYDIKGRYYYCEKFNQLPPHVCLGFDCRGSHGSLSAMPKILPDVMEAIQFFLLVDLTLMFLYWLVHTHHAHLMFQVERSNNRIDFNFQFFFFQECLFPAFAPLLGRVVEFSRVFLLSDSSSKDSLFFLAKHSVKPSSIEKFGCETLIWYK